MANKGRQPCLYPCLLLLFYCVLFVYLSSILSAYLPIYLLITYHLSIYCLYIPISRSLFKHALKGHVFFHVHAQQNSILKTMITTCLSLFSTDFVPSLCSVFASSVYFLGHKTKNKILYPMMLLALRSPHLEGTVIFGHL